MSATICGKLAAAKRSLPFALLLANLSGLSLDAADVSKLPPPASQQVDFARDVRPILESSCVRCHGPIKPKSHFRLDNAEDALKGGNNGVDILPGDSSKSLLIYCVAGLEPDMVMPPPGKGDRLTTKQVSLLRAWIDQGVAWDKSAPTNTFALSLSPEFGGTAVNGNAAKFRELNWQPSGLNGGLADFNLTGKSGPDDKYSFAGHALRDDYKLNLSLDRSDVGFIRAGWEEYKKYYSDTGGYFPAISSSAPNDGRDLSLSIGKAWLDLGLTLPRWPQMKLGYEYDYKQGAEGATDWGLYRPNDARAVGPSAQGINEEVHIIKFDLDHDIAGATIEERFRGEFYNLQTHYTNLDVRGAMPSENAREGNSYFQGANTIRIERRFDDVFFASAGYLYSKLNSDANFTDSINNNPLLFINVPRITLEKESHVFNANGLVGPLAGLTFSMGVQAEWSAQQGLGGNSAFLNPVYTNGLSFAPVTVDVVPTALLSDYYQSTVTESAALRYSKIPFTSLFLEGKLQQETIGQYDNDIQAGSGFAQLTDFSSHVSELRAGFNTSPWRSVSLSAHYRRSETDSSYNNDPGAAPPAGYPGFIVARELLIDEVETRLSWRAAHWLRTSLTYRWQASRYTDDTDAIGAGVSSGGQLEGGEYRTQTYAANATMTPVARLFLSATVSYAPTTSTSADNGVPEIAAYRGETYSVIASGTYVLSQNFDAFATYSFSTSDFAQENGAVGLPLGIQYEQNGLQAGLVRHLRRNMTLQLKYGFYNYNEPGSGTANNYTAHSVFASLTCKLP